MNITSGYLLLAGIMSQVAFADWPQGGGPHSNYTIDDTGPAAFSASANKGIRWCVDLSETGQSTPVIAGGNIFLTCFPPATEATKIGRDVVGYCFEQQTGKQRWRVMLPGEHDSKISGCFGDNSGPAAVSNGRSVCFFNASGLIQNFTFEGKLNWSTTLRHSTRCDPYLLDNTLIVNGSTESNSIIGRHLTGIDFKTGEHIWQSENFSWESTTSIPFQMSDGRWVALIARGGGHAKGKFKDGISLIDLKTGKEIWEVLIPHLRSTQNYRLANDRAFVFLATGRQRVFDLESGKMIREDDLVTDAKVDLYRAGIYHYGGFEKPPNFRKRTMIQMSNLLVGKYHYFRTYTGSFLGRVDIETGKTEYLHLPGKLVRNEHETMLGWNKRLPPNAMVSNSGYRVVGDERSVNNGWGHHTSALPTVCGERLYIPTMCGLVYVIKWDTKILDHHALVSISDLGELGDSWNRSSISFSDGLLYARTIKKLICISGCDPEDLPNLVSELSK